MKLDKIIDFLLHPLAILSLLFSLIFLSAWFLVSKEAKERSLFMEECLQERKQYECTAMWRPGEKDTNFIYMGRP